MTSKFGFIVGLLFISSILAAPPREGRHGTVRMGSNNRVASGVGAFYFMTNDLQVNRV